MSKNRQQTIDDLKLWLTNFSAPGTWGRGKLPKGFKWLVTMGGISIYDYSTYVKYSRDDIWGTPPKHFSYTRCVDVTVKVGSTPINKGSMVTAEMINFDNDRLEPCGQSFDELMGSLKSES